MENNHFLGWTELRPYNVYGLGEMGRLELKPNLGVGGEIMVSVMASVHDVWNMWVAMVSDLLMFIRNE